MKTLQFVVLCVLASAHLIKADSEEDSEEFGVESLPGPKTTNCSCGLANRGDLQRIIGGVETKENEYPYMAGLVYKPKKILFCGGSIITKRHVLTAAHCIEPLFYRLEDLEVVLGEHDQRKVETSGATVYIDVDRALMHRHYYIVGHKNDIAMLYLAEDIKFTKFISPVCLFTKPISFENKRVKVLGWGKLSSDGPASKVLMKVMLNVVPLERCNKTYDYIDMEEPTQLCTFHPHKDSCQGDSGGPLLYLDPETNRYHLAGVTSFGKECAAGFPGVNVDVTKYISWIQSKIEESAPGLQTCCRVD